MRKFILALLLASPLFQPAPGNAAEMLVFFGTSRLGTNRGFSISHFNSDTGALTPPTFAQEAVAPAFFTIAPDGKHLYTCNSIGSVRMTNGTVTAYALDAKTGKLTMLNSKPTGGGEPVNITLDRTGRFVLVANYHTGNLNVFAIQPDGSLGDQTGAAQQVGSSINAQRQSHSFAHSIVVSPDNRFALSGDLGADKVFVYRFNDKDGSLVPNDPPSASIKPGSGPRHVKFHPTGKYVYVISEMASTITVFGWDAAKGVMTETQTISTLPEDFKTTSTCAEIEVDPSGRFVYGSNRGHNSLAVFAIDAATGKLTLIEHAPTQGRNPRNFAFDPTGRWIIATNPDTSNGVVFRVDETTGRLKQVGEPFSVPTPLCERFVLVP